MATGMVSERPSVETSGDVSSIDCSHTQSLSTVPTRPLSVRKPTTCHDGQLNTSRPV